jgi:hypothetical protein
VNVDRKGGSLLCISRGCPSMIAADGLLCVRATIGLISEDEIREFEYESMHVWVELENEWEWPLKWVNECKLSGEWMSRAFAVSVFLEYPITPSLPLEFHSVPTVG